MSNIKWTKQVIYTCVHIYIHICSNNKEDVIEGVSWEGKSDINMALTYKNLKNKVEEQLKKD